MPRLVFQRRDEVVFGTLGCDYGVPAWLGWMVLALLGLHHVRDRAPDPKWRRAVWTDLQGVVIAMGMLYFGALLGGIIAVLSCLVG